MSAPNLLLLDRMHVRCRTRRQGRLDLLHEVGGREWFRDEVEGPRPHHVDRGLEITVARHKNNRDTGREPELADLIEDAQPRGPEPRRMSRSMQVGFVTDPP